MRPDIASFQPQFVSIRLVFSNKSGHVNFYGVLTAVALCEVAMKLKVSLQLK